MGDGGFTVSGGAAFAVGVGDWGGWWCWSGILGGDGGFKCGAGGGL